MLKKTWIIFFLSVICWGSGVAIAQPQSPVAASASPSLNKVSVLGGVKKPGKYENQKATSLIDVLAKAGGPTRFANTHDIRITHADGRVVNFNLELYSKNPKHQTLALVYPGDEVFVPEKAHSAAKSWLDAQPNQAIQLLGAVVRPGRYEWSTELSLLDIIAHAGGPTANADVAHIKIIPPPSKYAKKKPDIFDMELFIRQGGNLKLLPPVKAGYTVIVPELVTGTLNDKTRWVRQPSSSSIYIFGEVRRPGRYAFNKNMGFLDLISAADGPSNNANINDIRILHRDTQRPEVSKVNLGLYFRTGDPSLLPDVVPEDAIYVPSITGGNWTNRNTKDRVRVLGAVTTPGSYPFSDEMNVVDVLTEAGGTTATALMDHILVVHPGAKQRRAVNFDLLGYAKSGDPRLLPILRVGDIVFVPDEKQGHWRRFMEKARDVSALLVILRIAEVI